ncbi:MAG TPA: hypothetical protein VEK08_04565 [Planctomycetota bacterium]|nr:hypothetical protein [Planctomycetota bacterium]
MKRRWFQLHLSTCVVLMLLSGVLTQANLYVRLVFRRTFSQPEDTFTATWDYHGCGWPTYYTSGIWPDQTFHPLRLAANVFVVLLIMILAAISLEYIARRREDRTP